MSKSLSLTIIDDKNFRGILAPSSIVSKKMLVDLIDFIELSTIAEIRETESRIKEADRNNSWIPGKEVERRLKARLKANK